MKTVRGHFDGERVVLDEPVPEDVAPDTPVKIVFDDHGADSVLDKLAGLAELDDLPTDYSEQHEHYVKGTPRR